MDFAEVSKHNSRDSCWVILYGQVYDVTSFLPDHPGGAKIILQLAGQDATDEYDPVHPDGTLQSSLPPSALIGSIDESTLPKAEKSPTTDGEQSGPPPLDTLLNLDDIENAASPLLSRKAWAYYYSGADDLYSKRLNTRVYSNILLRPRVFVDCTECDTSTSILGNRVDVPFYVSPAAMARLAHTTGEKGIAAACAKYGAAHVISNNASMTPEQILEDSEDAQVFGWQIYVQTNRKKSEDMLARIEALKPKMKYLVLTLDAPVPGKREHDERAKSIGANLPLRSAVQSDTTDDPKGASSPGEQGQKDSGGGGLGKSLFAGTAPDLTWRTTLPWLAKHSTLPLVLKGIATHEDAYLASLHAPQVRAIVLSNHGGRAMDTAPPAVHTLLEIRKYCPEVFDRVEVHVDGGIRRGTDIVKALCLGAKAVGLGRAPLYSLALGGPEGVERMCQILKEEVETCMRLLGCKVVSELGLQHINTSAVERDIFDGPANLPLKPRLWLKSKF